MLKMMIVVLANYHLSITLKEWLKLNVGIISKEDHVDIQTIKIFATHHAKDIDHIVIRINVRL